MAKAPTLKDSNPESPVAPAQQAPSEESRLFSVISYIFGMLIAIIVFLVKKDDMFARFHAVQSILLDIVIMVLGFVLMAIGMVAIVVLGIATMGIGFVIGFWVVWLGFMVMAVCLFIFRLFLAYKAYKGQMFQLPIIGKHAARIAAGG